MAGTVLVRATPSRSISPLDFVAISGEAIIHAAESPRVLRRLGAIQFPSVVLAMRPFPPNVVSRRELGRCGSLLGRKATSATAFTVTLIGKPLRNFAPKFEDLGRGMPRGDLWQLGMPLAPQEGRNIELVFIDLQTALS
jgi:hypothetical protein